METIYPMAKRTGSAQHLEPTFVEFIPEHLDPGRLYVAMEYGAVAHLCACGCGSKVDTPLTPTDWMLKYDGEAVTLNPSIGSWSLPCRSHYFIVANRIRWAGSWSDEQVRAGRAADQQAKQRHYEVHDTTMPESADVDSNSKPSWVVSVWKWFTSRWSR